MNMRHTLSPLSPLSVVRQPAGGSTGDQGNARGHQELLPPRDDGRVRGSDYVRRDARDQEDGIRVGHQPARSAGAWRGHREARAAAKAAGLRYYHVPFNGAKPDPKAADQFVKIISSKEAAPAFIHCASANRASAMWMIKRSWSTSGRSSARRKKPRRWD